MFEALKTQLESLGHLCTGVWRGAKDMAQSIVDHPLDAVGEFANGVPIVGHIKGLVHFATGDTEGGIHAEEVASRTLVVMGAAALTGMTGGLAAPILGGVIGGVLADGILTGIETQRKGKYDPQGGIDIGTNVVRDIQKGDMEHLGTDIFDGVVLAAGDGMVGSSTVKGPAKVGKTTKVFRVEGKSLVRNGDGSQLSHFRAGDNQRIFHYQGAVVAREHLPALTDPESLRTGHAPLEPRGTIHEEPSGSNTGRGGPKPGRGGPKSGRGGDPPIDRALGLISPDLFDDKGNMIFLNFGNEDRAYGYYAQKVTEHRKLAAKYRPLFEQAKSRSSTVTERTHQIRVKSFEVLTRELEDIERDAVTERERETDNYRGVLKVDIKAPRQYGLETSRYTPIFEKMIPDSFRAEPLWIRHLPTSILKLINEHPVGFGKVRRFRYRRVAAMSGATAIHIKQLPHVSKTEPVDSEDVTPRTIAHCRHVKTIRPATAEAPAETSEHYEYLVKFDKDQPAEWYPEQLVALNLRKAFYERAMASAKPVSSVKRSPDDNGKLLVERPDGSWDEIDPRQIFWDEQESGANPLGLRELDAIMYHLYRENPDDGVRARLHTDQLLPNANVLHAAPCADNDGSPVYIGSALHVNGGVHPCKIVSRFQSSRKACRVPYGGEEICHVGEYDLLPFVPEVMEFVEAERGHPPPLRRPILGGYEADGKRLYHAIALVDGVWVPGKAAPHLNGAQVAYDDKENWRPDCKILCWK
ncbi:hypothetical protein QBC40DRAFT_319439 [Triangularia verruculosa]|uniref:Uncharacterized protein n=1 Tax=Triangularia verruculosa TaxID=2587418 RepID=A0AAN6X5T0_9PEZI|nr:hypothetical protein QBC40DRAFT_319439 [Triangularia verruculosa]